MADNYYRGGIKQVNNEALLKAMEDTRDELIQYINADINVVGDLRAFMLALSSMPDDESFDRFAALLLENYPQTLVAQYVDPDLRIRYIYPLVGNELALNLDLTTRPAAPFIAKAIRERQLVVNDPTLTVQGSLSVIPRLPLYKGDEFLGLVQVITEIDPLLEDVTKNLDDRFQIQLRSSEGVYFWGIEGFDGETVSAKIPIGDNFWSLTVGWRTVPPGADFFVLTLIWGVGGVLLLSVLFIVNQTWNQTERLKRSVAERTQELEVEIARRQRVEEELRDLNLSLEHILSASPLPILGTEDNGHITRWNRAAEKLFGWSEEEVLGKICPTVPSDEIQDYLEMINKAVQGETSLSLIRYRQKKDGSRILCNVSAAPQINEEGKTIGVTLIIEDITERKQAEEAVQAAEERFRTLVENSSDEISIISAEGKLLYESPTSNPTLGYPFGEFLDRGIFQIIHPDDLDRIQNHLTKLIQEPDHQIREQFRLLHRDGSWRWVEGVGTNLLAEPSVGGIVINYHDITERKQAEERIVFQSNLLSAVGSAVIATDLNGQVLYWNPAAEKMYGWSASEALGKSIMEVSPAPQSQEQAQEIMAQLTNGKTWSGEFIVQRRDGSTFPAFVSDSPIWDSNGKLVGIIGVSNDITEPKRAENKLKLQMERMHAMSNIDRAISSSLDMRISLDVLLREVLSQLEVDAATVLLLKPSTQTLEFVAGKGFRSPSIRQTRVRLGEGLAGHVGLERKVLHIPNLPEAGDEFTRAELFTIEEFIEYLAVPLIAKGVLKGVLEIYHRTSLDLDPEWKSYLEALSGQAAIAIDSAQLFEGMQKSNQELVMAYDATIAGWSRAMDLRDEETEGHTQRVTELTLRLAEKFGISQQEQVQIRRGALLHDIGKLGVPDGILLKPGKLTDEEWKIMRQHPNSAYEMLMPITYLRPAMDIPYCHHEKWDGSGYPRGLKGEQIPLAARIFAVIDVWDALTSDRPYRSAWTKERALEYIKEQSGKHFDPDIVEVFLETVPKEIK